MNSQDQPNVMKTSVSTMAFTFVSSVLLLLLFFILLFVSFSCLTLPVTLLIFWFLPNSALSYEIMRVIFSICPVCSFASCFWQQMQRRIAVLTCPLPVSWEPAGKGAESCFRLRVYTLGVFREQQGADSAISPLDACMLFVFLRWLSLWPSGPLASAPEAL